MPVASARPSIRIEGAGPVDVEMSAGRLVAESCRRCRVAPSPRLQVLRYWRRRLHRVMRRPQGTTAQIANAAGIGAIGAAFFVIEAATSGLALFAAFALFALSIGASAAFLSRMRRAST